MDLPSNGTAARDPRGLGRGSESKKRKVVLSTLLIARVNSRSIIQLAGKLSSHSEHSYDAKRGSLYPQVRFIADLSVGNSPTTIVDNKGFIAE